MRGRTTQCVKRGGGQNFFDFGKTNKAILFLWLNRVLSNLVPIKFQHFCPIFGQKRAIFCQCLTHLEPLEVPMAENGHYWQYMTLFFGQKWGKNAEI